jgi:DNA-binding CsgD family transcriptional regulator
MRMLEALGADLEEALERVNLPMFFVDDKGRVRWQNAAAEALVGNEQGRLAFRRGLPPEYVNEAQRAFSRKLLGSEGSVDREWVILAADDSRVRFVTSGVPVSGRDRVVGVLCIGRVVGAVERRPAPPHLTPRQFEALRLLAEGLSTGQIAERLGVSRETARGHIRRLLAALDAHSRLEAVARGRERGLI